MRFRLQVILALLGIAALYVVGKLVIRIARPRAVAQAAVPNAIEFRVVQKFNWSGEPFTTACYYQKPGGLWGWFYYDHEDDYWESGTAQVDPVAKRISIVRDGNVTVTFDWESETYQKWSKGRVEREIKGAQSWMPNGWQPPN